MKKKITNKIFALLAFTIGASTLYAQSFDISKVEGALTEGADNIGSLFGAASKIVYASCAIIGLISAVNVFIKFSSGDQDASKKAGAWLAACLVIFIFVKILEAVFF